MWAFETEEEEAVEAVVGLDGVVSEAADSSREPLMLAETLQRRAVVYRRNSPVYSHDHGENYPHNSQADVEAVEPGVETIPESETDAESEPLRRPPPPGHFVSGEHQSDCARFLAEAKSLARRRFEAGLVLGV